MKVHVSNLGSNVKYEDLKQLFISYGEVKSLKITMDRETGGGFAFVEMTDQAAAKSAIAGLNNTSLDGRKLRVCQAGNEGQKGSGMYKVKSKPTKNKRPYSGF